MRVVLDTNVLVSGIFFGGLPGQIIDAWTGGSIELVLTPKIFEEYKRICERLASSRRPLPYEPVLTAILGSGVLVADDPEAEGITVDPDDDKFMRCARRGDAVVVSGDSDLLDAAGWQGVEVLSPRRVLELLERC